MTHVFTTPHKGSDSPERTGHEQVAFCQDARSGLKAIIAIYSTALGPSLGGTRFYPYGSEEEALADALRLSAAMAYKNALAGLDHGGGKAVIIGDPAELKSEALLRAYGRFIDSLGGRYITACDVGTYSEDMDIIARESRWVTGRTPAYGGAGDSSVLTALGVFAGLRAAAGHVWGSTSLRGRRVGVEGVGKVGRKLVSHLVEDGAEVVICDVSQTAVDGVRARHPEVEVVAGAAELLAANLDVFAPCALGGSVDDQVAATLEAKIICGGANNQLAAAAHDDALAARGITFVPDYLANAGGVIDFYQESIDDRPEAVLASVERIRGITTDVLQRAATSGETPLRVADRTVQERLQAAQARRRAS